LFSVRLAPSRWGESRSMSPCLPGYRCHAPPPLRPRCLVHGGPPKRVLGSRESRRQLLTRGSGESVLW
jgi:hypothetical protein